MENYGQVPNEVDGTGQICQGCARFIPDTPPPLPCLGHLSTPPLLVTFTVTTACNFYPLTD